MVCEGHLISAIFLNMLLKSSHRTWFERCTHLCFYVPFLGYSQRTHPLGLQMINYMNIRVPFRFSHFCATNMWNIFLQIEKLPEIQVLTQLQAMNLYYPKLPTPNLIVFGFVSLTGCNGSPGPAWKNSERVRKTKPLILYLNTVLIL